MTKLMRNVRTGKLAVYDRELVETGRWIDLEEETAQKKLAEDTLVLKDEIEVVVTRSTDEVIELEA